MNEKISTNGQLAPLIPASKFPPSKIHIHPGHLRHPIEVALLNLSGLGLGYLYVRAWVRWTIYFLISIGLVVTAFVTNAHDRPVVWGLVFPFWIVWMTLDGWLLAKRQAQGFPGQTAEWRKGILIAGAGILAVMIAGLFGYNLLGQNEFKQGVIAFEGSDFQRAKGHFQRVTRFYELTLNPIITKADIKIEECDLLISAEAAREKGQFQTAISIFEAYLSDYSDSPSVIAYIEESAAQTYYDWAIQLHLAKDYEQAVEKYQAVLSGYENTAVRKQIIPAIAETYVEWGTELRQKGQYQDAIEKYQNLENYPEAPLAQQMDALIAETYLQWAQTLRENNKFETAIEKYQYIISRYEQTPAIRIATSEIAVSYAAWAAFLRAGNHYQEAIQKYQTLLEDYPLSEDGKKAENQIAQTYIDWGLHLIDIRDYFGAMDKFEAAKKDIEDEQIANAADQGHEDALVGLSQDTTGQGKQVITESLKEVCAGKAATSPVIGFKVNEPGRALFCDSTSSIPVELPSNLKATKPEHFLYALGFSSGEDRVQSCPYSGGYSLVRMRYWWKVEIYNTLSGKIIKTKKFSGSSPGSCPYIYTFTIGFRTSYLYGGQPSESELMSWLEKSFK
jgi:tetratricopeptide (TPR) repeat protein